MTSENMSILTQEFKNRFGFYSNIVFAPGRANIIGEHTDYNDGWVFPFAIAQGLYFVMGPAENDQMNIYAYDKQELLGSRINDDACPYHWCTYIRQVLKALQYRGPGFNLVFGGNLPTGSGVSSSSALTCGFLYCLSNYARLNLDNNDLLRLSVLAERGSGVRGGQMDQYTIINGIEGHAVLLDCKDMAGNFISLDSEYFRFLLINSRVHHKLADSEYNNRREECDAALSAIQSAEPDILSLRELHDQPIEWIWKLLNPVETRRLQHVINENERVLQMYKAIRQKDLWRAGTLLYQSHQSLSVLYEVSCPELDFLVNWASGQSNIYGARMMGGGFGGCTLNLIHENISADQIEQLYSSYYKSFGIHPELLYINPSSGLKTIL